MCERCDKIKNFITEESQRMRASIKEAGRGRAPKAKGARVASIRRSSDACIADEVKRLLGIHC